MTVRNVLNRNLNNGIISHQILSMASAIDSQRESVILSCSFIKLFPLCTWKE